MKCIQKKKKHFLFTSLALTIADLKSKSLTEPPAEQNKKYNLRCR